MFTTSYEVFTSVIWPQGVHFWLHPIIAKHYGVVYCGSKASCGRCLISHLQKTDGFCKHTAESALQTTLHNARD